MRHQLKTHPEPFKEIRDGRKTFEVRLNDRDFQFDDELLLLEWDPDTEEYTGESCTRFVDYILEGGQFGIEPGYVVMAIEGVTDEEFLINEVQADLAQALSLLSAITVSVPAHKVDIDADPDENPDGRGCLRCGGTWNLGEKEDHAPGCLFGRTQTWLKELKNHE